MVEDAGGEGKGLGEFDIIARYFAPLATDASALSLRDDGDSRCDKVTGLNRGWCGIGNSSSRISRRPRDARSHVRWVDDNCRASRRW